MDCNSGQFPPPVPVVPRTHNKDAKLSQGEMPIVEKVALSKGKGKAFKSFFTHKSHESTNARTIVLHQFPHSFNPRDNMAQACLAQALSRTQNALATARECKLQETRGCGHQKSLERVGSIACCQRRGGSAHTCQQKIRYKKDE